MFFLINGKSMEPESDGFKNPWKIDGKLKAMA